MATIMTGRNSELNRRCDARCYEARWLSCTCICGGKNHGIGLKEALINADEDRVLEAHDDADELHERGAEYHRESGLE